MHLFRLTLKNFMSHDSTNIKFPRAGVVLVTGNNGSGKSALMEGVSMALHGKTLRGTNPFRQSQAGFAEAEFEQDGDDYHAKLKFSGKNKRHEWRKNGCKNPYDTTTKSLTALASVTGSFDIWRRTHVFSSSDASSFTSATDSQRKQLLESLLGIDWFDRALKQCRSELKLAKPRMEDMADNIQTLVRDIATHSANLVKHKAEFATLEEPSSDEALASRQSKLSKMVRLTQEEAEQMHAKAHRLRTAGEVEAREAQNLKRKAEAMPDNCFTCGQSIPTDNREALAKLAVDKMADAKQKRAKGKAALADMDEYMADIKSDLRRLEEKLTKVSVDTQTASLARSHYSFVKHAVDSAQEQAESLTKRHKALETAVVAAAVELAELEACSNILGFKGVRAQVLGHALAGIEQMANLWLARLISSDLTVDLSSYKENKSGGQQDSISLTVHGAGGGHGYAGASGGERRRIDVAILFALAEVAANVHGTHGTLFFDEIFDALDEVGISAVTDALQELAKDRAVVVISHTHANDLAQIAVQEIYVEDGEARVSTSVDLSARELQQDW